MDFAKLFSLEGKVALITGGSRGIGKMLLEGYLAAGCERVYITARKREQIAETVAEFEAQYPGKVIGLPGDLSQMEDVKRLAQELASRNITVNCVAPGFIRSAMTDVLPEAQKAALLTKIPTGDLGTGEDIAAAVAYLASREAGYVTGQTLHVNGGMAMV